jgi:hypothetical protein
VRDTVPHAIVWFWNTGLHDPAWVQGFAAVAVVFLSLATLCVLIKYAIDTNAQAKASKKSADAAEAAANAAETAANAVLAQTQLMISKERARILVAPTEQRDFHVFPTQNSIGHHEFTLFNIGLTPAINVLVSYRAVANGFETHTVGKPNCYAVFQHIIPANKEVGAPLFIDSCFAAAKAPAIFYIHVWGQVTYNDVLSSEQRTTKFGFRTQMTTKVNDTAIQVDSWMKSDNPEDNIAT